jgi:serine/threonine protein kinase
MTTSSSEREVPMPTLYKPGEYVDHYQILYQLGQGGSSRVYLAQDSQNQQKVVLKFPNDEEIGGAAIFARHQREAKLGTLLSHPSLQCHLNQQEERSRPYLVLEYLEGRTLRTMIHECEPELLPQETILNILSQVCDVLIYVHKQGVIHQDIKPDNIFVLETGEIKLIDFGIAQIENEKQGWYGFSSLVGTPDYMAPERLQGKPGTIRSDVYAIGIMLYELLCGRTPFQETDGFAIVSKHISHDPQDILSINPTLSPALATIVMQAIRRNPKRRYTSIAALQHDLNAPNQVTAIPYVPDSPLFGGPYRQAIGIAGLVFLLCCAIVAFGLLAQLAHHLAR